jgi:Tfp pilus assembly protein PilF
LDYLAPRICTDMAEPLGWRFRRGRNPRFVGREAELAELGRRLRADAIQVVVGSAGVGKTQLAIEYAHRHARRYRLISWLRAHRREAVTGWGRSFGRERGTLLVLDDTTPEVVRECLPAGPGHVLVTSRESGWAALAGTMLLAPLDEAEASALLLGERGRRAHSVARELVAALGRLPLALELAARLTTAGEHSLEEYLARFIERRRDHSPGLVTACGLSYETVAIRRPGATLLLDSAALLDAEHIPLHLLDAGLSDSELPAMVALLDRVGLVERLPDGLRMGRAVQEFVRARMGQVHQRPRTTDLVTILARTLLATPEESPVEHFLPHALALAEAGTSLRCAPAATAELWNAVGRLLQERADQKGAREAFLHSLAVADQALGSDHESTFTASSNLATVLEDLGDGAGARAAFERAVAAAERAAEPDALGRVLANYGAFLQREGQPDEAAAVMRRALAALRAGCEPSDPEIAGAINTLGLALTDLGEYDDAREALGESLRLHEAAFGDRHPRVATVLNNLGLAHAAAGDQRQAQHHHRRALEIDEAVLGPEHPDVATDLNNLGLALQALGDAGARPLFERALRIVEGTSDDLRVAVITSNLGLAHHAAGAHRQARAAHERALRLTEEVLGPDHPGLRNLLNNLGAALQALGDLEGAGAAFARALRLAEGALGASHPDVATALANLGHALLAMGDEEGARRVLRRSLEIMRQFVGEEHPLVRSLRAAVGALEGGDGGAGRGH